MNEKLLNTMKVFDSYEKRFAKVRFEKENIFSIQEEHRKKLLDSVKHMIGFKEEYVPQITDFEVVSEVAYDGYTVKEVKYKSYENTYVSATFTLPNGNKKVPLVFAFCGHNKNGRHSDAILLLHHRLAKMGVAVITPDNIGQGDREFMGHRKAVEPFYCGLTIQGLIVMESIGLIRFMQNHPRIDGSKMASCGNSGGGTLNLFLSALAKELSAVASTGYPSEFGYILSKERRHCTCNLLPGSALGPEMWEIYGLCAPKPLLLSQGLWDDLIPVDLFYRNARKVNMIYSLFGAEQNLKSTVTKSKHPWNEEDRTILAEFFASVFGIKVKDFNEKDFSFTPTPVLTFPKDAATTIQIVENLSGKKIPENLKLWDLFPPNVNGKPISSIDMLTDIGRGDLNLIFAQMECALSKEW